MKITKETLLIILLFGILALITFFVLQRSTEETSYIPYSTYSDSIYGLKSLHDTLKKLKFRVERVRSNPYLLDPDLSALFLIQPRLTPNADSRAEIQTFVEQGGTLIIATTHNLNGLPADYGMQILRSGQPLIASYRLSPDPFFKDAPVDRFISLTTHEIRPTTHQSAPLYGAEGKHTIITRRIGAGRVFVLSCPYIFTNDGLGFEENATLVYNLITHLPPKSRIGFDEYHHGYYIHSTTSEHEREGVSDNIMGLFWQIPIGWALLYTGLLILIFLFLRGRRFGQPIEPNKSKRRLSSEYVFAMENLYRKGKKRAAILKHIRNEFRRTLTTTYNISPTLDIPTLTAEIAQRKPTIDPNELKSLLEALEQTTNPTEAQLLTFAQRVQRFQDHISR